MTTWGGPALSQPALSQRDVPTCLRSAVGCQLVRDIAPSVTALCTDNAVTNALQGAAQPSSSPTGWMPVRPVDQPQRHAFLLAVQGKLRRVGSLIARRQHVERRRAVECRPLRPAQLPA